MLDMEQETLLHLSSTFSKLLKRSFGKGPESCFVSSHDSRLIIVIRHFLTPPEEVLLQKQKIGLIDRFRSAVMDVVVDEFTEEVSRVFGDSYPSYYADWDYTTNSALILLEGQGKKPWLDYRSYTRFQELLSEEISKLSAGLQKRPSMIDVVKVHQNLVVTVCEGVLMPFEKVMYEQKHYALLSERSREIKQGFVAKLNEFEHVFGRKIANLYLTWDYKNDKSHMFFSLK